MFGFSGLLVLESPLIAKLFGLGSLGVIMGSVGFVSATLSTSGAIVTGYIFDIVGSYQLAFLIFAGVSIIGLMLSLLLRPINNK